MSVSRRLGLHRFILPAYLLDRADWYQLHLMEGLARLPIIIDELTLCDGVLANILGFFLLSLTL